MNLKETQMRPFSLICALTLGLAGANAVTSAGLSWEYLPARLASLIGLNGAPLGNVAIEKQWLKNDQDHAKKQQNLRNLWVRTHEFEDKIACTAAYNRLHQALDDSGGVPFPNPC
jgi:hypothetical protein